MRKPSSIAKPGADSAKDPGAERVLERGREVVRIEADALHRLVDALDHNFAEACRLIVGAGRRLVVTGMGKSGHIARKIAATFAATGTPAMFMHPAEAAHGDLGMVVPGDVLLVLSNSGNTAELRAVLHYARSLGVRIIGVAARRASLVIELADIGLLLPKVREACSANVAPTTSTTLQLALGDALAMAVMDLRGVSASQLRTLHPAGSIGLRLAPIAELMHGPDELPLINAGTRMPEVISVITGGRFGLAGVVDAAGGLIGIITDGDLRRHFDALATATAAEVMTRQPKSLPSDMLAAEALAFLNGNQITAAFVLDRHDAARPHRPVGIVHIHDLLRHGLN